MAVDYNTGLLSASQIDALYNALLAASPEDSWIEQNMGRIKDPTMGLLDNAAQQWGYDRVLGALNAAPWMQNYAMNIAKYSLGVGDPVYNRRGDEGLSAGLMYVPGFRGTAAGSLANSETDQFGLYDEFGRYKGKRPGGYYKGVGWVY